MGELKPTTKIQILGYNLVNVSKAPLEKVYHEHIDFGPAETQSLNDTETDFNFQDENAQHVILSSKDKSHKLIGTHNWYNKKLKFTVDSYDTVSFENMTAKQIGKRTLQESDSGLKYINYYDVDEDGYADITVEERINPRSLHIAPGEVKTQKEQLESQKNKTEQANSDLRTEKAKTHSLESNQKKLEQELTALKEKNRQADLTITEQGNKLTEHKAIEDLTGAIDKLTNVLDSKKETPKSVNSVQAATPAEKHAKVAFLAAEVGALEERIKQLNAEKERLTGKKATVKPQENKQTKTIEQTPSVEDIIQQLETQLAGLQKEEQTLQAEVKQLKSKQGVPGLLKNFMMDAGQYFENFKPSETRNKKADKPQSVPTIEAPRRLFPGSGEFKPEIVPEKTLPTGGEDKDQF